MLSSDVPLLLLNQPTIWNRTEHLGEKCSCFRIQYLLYFIVGTKHNFVKFISQGHRTQLPRSIDKGNGSHAKMLQRGLVYSPLTIHHLVNTVGDHKKIEPPFLGRTRIIMQSNGIKGLRVIINMSTPNNKTALLKEE